MHSARCSWKGLGLHLESHQEHLEAVIIANKYEPAAA